MCEWNGKKTFQCTTINQLKHFNTEYIAYQFIVNYPLKFFICLCTSDSYPTFHVTGHVH